MKHNLVWSYHRGGLLLGSVIEYVKNKTHIFTGLNKTGEIPGLLFSCNVAVDLVCCSKIPTEKILL